MFLSFCSGAPNHAIMPGMRSLVLALALLLMGCPATTPKPVVKPQPTPRVDPDASRLVLVGQVPDTARIQIDGKTTGSLTDLQTKGVALPAGVHRLEVRAPGFRPFRLELKLAKGRTERLTITLEPIQR
jgi:hypothetical protein